MNKIIVISMVLVAVHAQAVIVAGGDGTQNTTLPAGDQGWSNVGRITGSAPSSVTYLDNNWFITANHVKLYDNPTGVTLGLSDYAIDDSSWTRITNSAGTNADLVMFRVDGSVSVPSMELSSVLPAAGTNVTMIGNGLDRYPGLISALGELLYLVKSGAANTSKRWGTNTIEGDGGTREFTHVASGDTSYTESFYTAFDLLSGEAQGEVWDSGGGVFAKNDGEWELAGIMIEVENRYSIGGTNAVMLSGGAFLPGSETYVADLSVYSSQINATTAIPEPAVFGLICIFGMGLLVAKRFVA